MTVDFTNWDEGGHLEVAADGIDNALGQLKEYREDVSPMDPEDSRFTRWFPEFRAIYSGDPQWQSGVCTWRLKDNEGHRYLLRLEADPDGV